MPEKDLEKKKEPESPINDGEKGAWAEDIRERGYYYDDAHGYEQYDPASDETEDE